MADISKYTTLDGTTYNLKDPVARASIAFGQVDSTSTATAFTAQIPGIDSYYDGLAIMLKNGIVTSASGFTININNLGAKHAYNNMTAATAETTLFNVNYTMLFVYDSTRVEGGGWIMYRGYDANTNTIGYQIRTNSSTRPVSDQTGRYRLLFSSADDTKWIPANTSSSTNATATRAVNQRPINPFGDIVYYGYTTVYASGSNVSTSYQWQEYALTLGYSFNRTGAALVLPYPKPIYVKCAPQADGSAIMDADTPYVTALPSTNDGKIYIYLGMTYSATSIELKINHPVFYHDGTGIKIWTGGIVHDAAKVDVSVSRNSCVSTISNSGESIQFDVTKTVGGVTTNSGIVINDDGILMNGNLGAPMKLENVATPTVTTDAANKDYVDSAISALPTVYVLEGQLTASLILSPTFDTFTLTSGDINLIENYDSAVLKVKVVNKNDTSVVYGYIKAYLTNDYAPISNQNVYGITFNGMIQFHDLFDYTVPTSVSFIYNSYNQTWAYRVYYIAQNIHTHGSMNVYGEITDTGIDIANGDALVITDASNSNRIRKTSITFDGTSKTKALTQKGTFEPLFIELTGTLTFQLSSTTGTGTFTLTGGDPSLLYGNANAWIVADIHSFSGLTRDTIILRKARSAATGNGIEMFNGEFQVTGGTTVYIEVEGMPDDEYNWDYATWTATYTMLQTKTSI